jgi:hypothetical protein
VESTEGAVEPTPDEFLRVRVGLHLLVDGHLNPFIFVPEWFHKEDLLRDYEIDDAKKSLATDSSFLAFKTEDFSFVVSRNSLEIFSNSGHLELTLRDLMLNIFSLLRHTPLTRLTISRSAHLASAASPAVSPHWPSLLPPSPFEPLLGKPTVVDVSAQGSAGPVPEGSQVAISIQPSSIENATLFIECKYSYNLLSDEDTGSATVFHDILKNAIEATRDHSETAYDTFSKLLLKQSASRSKRRN